MASDTFKAYKSNTSLRILSGILVVAFIFLALLFYYRQPLFNVYFKQNLTPVALILNGLILALFTLGMARLFVLLMRCRKEEQALTKFLGFLRHHKPGETPNIPPDSMIARRYYAMSKAYQHGTTPDHAALSQVLMAEENNRGILPRYINSILILAGVFGTMVSLSIALYGASSLLDTSGGDASGINLVVQGMSTALSTTIIAILCYAIFGFFYLRTNVARTRIITAIESLTTEYLMPRFKIKSENLPDELASLIETLHGVAKNLQTAQSEHIASEKLMHSAITEHSHHMLQVSQQLGQIRQLLSRGFRLREEPNE